MTAGVGGALAVALAVDRRCSAAPGAITPALRRELWLRAALLAGADAADAGCRCWRARSGRCWRVIVLALLCYREYARATGLFREQPRQRRRRARHPVDEFRRARPLVRLLRRALAADGGPDRRRPRSRSTGPRATSSASGWRVFAFLLFGVGLGHLAYMANDWRYRPIVLLLLVAVALNDVFAFTVGKLLGGPKLLPNTSPNKTVVGRARRAGAHDERSSRRVRRRSSPARRWSSLALAACCSACWSASLGQLGDLMLSSIKRDIGIKDMGAAIPGHGGVLDRFNSLLLVAPAVFHYRRLLRRLRPRPAGAHHHRRRPMDAGSSARPATSGCRPASGCAAWRARPGWSASLLPRALARAGARLSRGCGTGSRCAGAENLPAAPPYRAGRQPRQPSRCARAVGARCALRPRGRAHALAAGDIFFDHAGRSAFAADAR